MGTRIQSLEHRTGMVGVGFLSSRSLLWSRFRLWSRPNFFSPVSYPIAGKTGLRWVKSETPIYLPDRTNITLILVTGYLGCVQRITSFKICCLSDHRNSNVMVRVENYYRIISLVLTQKVLPKPRKTIDHDWPSFYHLLRFPCKSFLHGVSKDNLRPYSSLNLQLHSWCPQEIVVNSQTHCGSKSSRSVVKVCPRTSFCNFCFVRIDAFA